MPTVEWNIPFSIQAPFGTLTLNEATGQRYLINQRRSVARRSIRAESDPIPHGDGEIFHDRYANGYEMQFAVQLWDGDEIACDEALCEMRDHLYGIIWSLLRPVDDGGRITWDPSCGDQRILDAVRLLSLQDPDEDAETGATEITFILDSPFPYAISLTESVVSMAASTPTTLPNGGNVTFYPVFKVNGAASSFVIQNNDTSEQYRYSSALPGASSIPGGSYAEIDMFRGGIIYLNGDQDNLKAGVDVEDSLILTVAAGGQSFTIEGASATVLMHDAWA